MVEEGFDPGLWLKVDASRRRNDPRKPTLGWWAWCGLGVRPARLKPEKRSSGGPGDNPERVPVAVAGRSAGECGVKDQVSRAWGLPKGGKRCRL